MAKRFSRKEVVSIIKNELGEDYELVSEYKNSTTPIKIKHIKCGFVYRKTLSGIKGRVSGKCPICESGTAIHGINDEEFKQMIKILTNDEYEPLDKYEGINKKIRFAHKKCNGVFEMTPNNFKNQNERCTVCVRPRSIRKTNKQFKKEVYDLVDDEYIFLEKYELAHKKILCKHNKCGNEWYISPSNFLRGKRCPNCRKNYYKKWTTQQFIDEVYKIVGNEYTVVGNYINARTHIDMKHNECGHVWGINPDNFLRGKRCPKCNDINFSKGMKRIEKYLLKSDIEFKNEYRIEECNNERPLPFDFAIFKNEKLYKLIEYQGRQHYSPYKYFGGKEGFEYQKHRDEIKRIYCEENNIDLIEIPYWDFDNIEDILNKELKEVI
ncbi:MAG: hypothetical protein ACOCZ5_01990 [bacterium]